MVSPRPLPKWTSSPQGDIKTTVCSRMDLGDFVNDVQIRCLVYCADQESDSEQSGSLAFANAAGSRHRLCGRACPAGNGSIGGNKQTLVSARGMEETHKGQANAAADGEITSPLRFR